MNATVPGVLARGPWDPARVQAHWSAEAYRPAESASAAADVALQGLRDRGSPSHDGQAARLADHRQRDGVLELDLQPVRWALRLLPEHAASSLSVLCVVRAADGRWLAGRRAAWLASWAGRWALGAGGAVEVDEHPAHTLVRELEEEWSVAPQRLTVEALAGVPSGLILLVGLAWLPDGAEVVPDSEHDAFAWWPADVGDWPSEAHAPLRRMATLLAQA